MSWCNPDLQSPGILDKREVKRAKSEKTWRIAYEISVIFWEKDCKGSKNFFINGYTQSTKFLTTKYTIKWFQCTFSLHKHRCSSDTSGIWNGMKTVKWNIKGKNLHPVAGGNVKWYSPLGKLFDSFLNS